MSRTTRSRWLARPLMALAGFAALGAAACRRHHVEGALSTDTVLKSWSTTGFDTEGIEKTDPSPWGAGACSHGTVSGLEILLCEFSSDDLLAKGEQRVMQDWEPQTPSTGITLRNSHTLLAISDLTEADKEGRTIAKLASAFRDAR